MTLSLQKCLEADPKLQHQNEQLKSQSTSVIMLKLYSPPRAVNFFQATVKMATKMITDQGTHQLAQAKECQHLFLLVECKQLNSLINKHRQTLYPEQA
jgi:hypothetical protein